MGKSQRPFTSKCSDGPGGVPSDLSKKLGGRADTALILVPMRLFKALLVVAALSRPVMAEWDPPELVPMPADVPPHRAGFIAGEHHYDIDPEAYEQHHLGDHWISYGQHNYDMSEDASVRDRFPYEKVRYRGMGRDFEERYSMLRRSLEDMDHHAEQPWVLSRVKHPGLAYTMPPDVAEEEWHKRDVGFPRPSWYAIYKKQKRVVRE